MSAQPYQVMPPLSAEEYEALKADVAEHGIRVPVDVDEAGNILDGHHRAAIAAELGIECPRRVIAGLDEEGKRHHAIAVNAHRRQLTREQRRELIRTELERDPSRSDRAIARLVGVDHKTVKAVRHGGWGIPQQRQEPSAAVLEAGREMYRYLKSVDLDPWNVLGWWREVQDIAQVCGFNAAASHVTDAGADIEERLPTRSPRQREYRAELLTWYYLIPMNALTIDYWKAGRDPVSPLLEWHFKDNVELFMSLLADGAAS